ncbi:3-isopropylmalate dehydratase small subunit [Buchnera aphidicola]|uniref:3-isopropylmalate dehydratase small subunit n=1 Tax=Buchnera aphidicola TaxID=9 RepID=UPI00094D453E|nr:3-isopropylmalate dehydratase small subunit [Buchnera aphidicola]
MKKFIKHSGKIVPIAASNIDTDIIIPKQFLQKINKIGFGKYLFYNWRFLDLEGKIKNKKFILNNKIYKNSSILLTRKNFGCGSSREHAVWALMDYGFKVIIANSFSDIFYNNSLSNRLLLITLSEKIIDMLFAIINEKKNIIGHIDLLQKKIIIEKKIISFNMSKPQIRSVISGLDQIDETMLYNKKINSYENNQYPEFIKYF